MKLYSDFGESEGESWETEATLSDLKAALAEHGLVAVKKADLVHVATGYEAMTEVPRYKRIAHSLIKASQA